MDEVNNLMTCIQDLKNAIDVRIRLIELKSLLTDEKYLLEYNKCIEDSSFLTDFLMHEDPKTRKNAALVLAKINHKESFEQLFLTYLNEEQLFIRPSLLKACDAFDLTNKLEILNKRLLVLNDLVKGENSKHYLDEQHVLRKIINAYETNNKKRHTFIGLDKEYPMILTTLKGHQDIVSDAMIEVTTKKVALGVQVKTKSLSDIMKYHCFNEILFPLVKVASCDEEVLADRIVHSSLVRFLNRVLSGEGGYLFRLTSFIKEEINQKKLVSLIETKSNSILINNPSNYEVELQLRENSKNEVLVYLKLGEITDLRFKYREQFLSNSINPVVAATIMQYIVPYIKSGSDVIDPFCGVGTMLIEREYVEKTHFIMGVDYYKEAINKAKRNTSLVDYNIHYVNRDSLSFTHRHEFDEIITNMPVYSKGLEKQSLENLYHQFFIKMDELLKCDGYAFLHTNEVGLIKKNLRKYKNHFKLVEEIKILNGKIGSYLFILKKIIE